MEEFIFVGNNESSLLQKMYAISRLKRLKLAERVNYGFRQSKDGKFFYLYNSCNEIICESVKFNKSGKPTYAELGYCEFTINKDNLHIDYIEVFQEFRGQGIGTAVLDYVKALAKNHKIKTITLDCLQTFTDGKKTITNYGGEVTEADIKELKEQSDIVVDINERFYVKNGFVKQVRRKPEFDHLVPMVLKKVVPAKPEITDCGKIFKFELSSELHKDVLKEENNFDSQTETEIKKREILKKYHITNKRII